MEMTQDGKKQIRLPSILLSILIILITYLALRLTVGELIKPKVVMAFNNLLVNYSSTGTTLSQISIDKLKTSGEIGSQISNINNLNQLDGGAGLQTTNPKVIAMKKFLLDYNSPMYAYSDVFITEAEKYGLDWRLVASISGVESAFGNLIPSNSNNGWGWRGGPAGAYSNFPTWKDGIKTVTKGLALGYGTTLTPFDIEQAYCPPCYSNPSHAWANGVTRFMSELNFYLNNLEKI